MGARTRRSVLSPGVGSTRKDISIGAPFPLALWQPVVLPPVEPPAPARDVRLRRFRLAGHEVVALVGVVLGPMPAGPVQCLVGLGPLVRPPLRAGRLREVNRVVERAASDRRVAGLTLVAGLLKIRLVFSCRARAGARRPGGSWPAPSGRGLGRVSTPRCRSRSRVWDRRSF